jgi:hypothetical protein
MSNGKEFFIATGSLFQPADLGQATYLHALERAVQKLEVKMDVLRKTVYEGGIPPSETLYQNTTRSVERATRAINNLIDEQVEHHVTQYEATRSEVAEAARLSRERIREMADLRRRLAQLGRGED